MDKPLKNQSNPYSTGGGGVNFETRIQAAFTVLMLTKSQAPCLPPWPITKIKLQGRFAGFHTDDFIIYTENPMNGNEVKLLAQIKHNISITEKNDVFKDVIRAAWEDYNNPDLFNAETDVLALITGPLSASDINNTRIILEWARYSECEEEFLKKIEMPDFSNETKRNKLKAFRENLKKANNGVDLTNKQLWKFLKRFHLLGFDLDTENGNSRSLILSSMSSAGIKNTSLRWSKILEVVQNANQSAGTLNLNTISEEVKEGFNSTTDTEWSYDIKKLKEHSEYILNGIRTNIGGVHIDRKDTFLELLKISEEEKFVFLSGERGCGKSSMVREFVEYIGDSAPVFCLRAEDFDKAHLDSVFSAIGLRGSIAQLQDRFALTKKKYLIVESVEKLLEIQNMMAFTDLIQFIRKNPGWTIIASGRSYAYQQIVFNILQPAGISYSTVLVKEFTDEETKHLTKSVPLLESLMSNKQIRPLLRNPFLAEMAFRITKSGTLFSKTDGEKEFQIAVWRDIIAKEQDRTNGLPVKRRQTFIDIAVKRAKKMVYGLPVADFDSSAILKLEEDNLIIRNPSTGMITLEHDVLEDWALIQHIENNYTSNLDDAVSFLNSLGYEPAINRAFRLWLHQKLRYSENVSDLIISIISNQKIEKCWQDEAIAAVFLGDNPDRFLKNLKRQLFQKNYQLLKRFCFILRISSKSPEQKMLYEVDSLLSNQNNSNKNLILKPYGPGWEAVILFLYKNKEIFPNELIPHVLGVLNDWATLINIEENLPKPAREAGLLALYLLEKLEDSYSSEEERKKLISIIIRLTTAIPNEFDEMVKKIILSSQNNRRSRFVDEFYEVSLTHLESAFLCKNNPSTLINIAYQDWLISDNEKENSMFNTRSDDIEDSFGLEEYRSTCSKFFPPSGLKGPFQYLLRFHPKIGLEFILNLLNITVEKYAVSDFDSPEKNEPLLFMIDDIGVQKLKIYLQDGKIIEQYCSNTLWLGYRGLSVMPYLLQCALMALENWLISCAENFKSKKALEWLFNYILKSSNSVAPTAILMSLAVGYPDKFGEVVLPLIKIPEFYELDMTRRIQERGNSELNFHNPFLNRDPLAELYGKERRTSALRSWRNEDLETLVVRLQCTSLRNDVFSIIDELRERMSDEKAWQFRFHRIDSRGWEPELDEENNRVVLKSGKLEPELEELEQESKVKQDWMNRYSKLALWADGRLENEFDETKYYDNWKEVLNECKLLFENLINEEEDNVPHFLLSGVVKAIAMLVRDYLNEMQDEDIKWCIDILLPIILENKRNDYTNYEKVDIDGSGVVASVIPCFFDICQEEEDKTFIKKVIATAVTHPSKVVRLGIANGVKEQMWSRDRDFGKMCIMGAVEFAKLKKNYVNELSDFNKDNAATHATFMEEIKELREQICTKEFEVNFDQITFSTHSSSELLTPCLMLDNDSSSSIHTNILNKMFTLLVEDEVYERDNRHNSDSRIDYELSLDFAKIFSSFLLRLPMERVSRFIQILTHSCEQAPNLTYNILLSVEYYCAKMDRKEFYWDLWSHLSEAVQNIAVSLSGNTSNDGSKIKLIKGMLHSDTPWQKVDYEKQEIAIGKDLIFEFVENVGNNKYVFEAMSSLMYHFPDVFLKNGLQLLSKQHEAVSRIHQFSQMNTVFFLENCIQNFLLNINKGSISKSMHQSCLVLLDEIVETASSKAYFLREYLIRSIRIEG